MKKIGIILLSLVIVGVSYGETNDQHLLTEKLNKANLNHSVEALIKTMREMEAKKEEAGGISDAEYKALSCQFILFSGINVSLLVSMANRGLGTQKILKDGALGLILGCVAGWVVAKVSFDLCGPYRITRKVEQQYQPKIEELKEKIHRKLTSGNFSQDEKKELIAYLKNVNGLRL